MQQRKVGILLFNEVLEGKKATTHWMDIGRLGTEFKVDVQQGVKYVDEGSIMTAGGISTGIICPCISFKSYWEKMMHDPQLGEWNMI